MRTGPLPPAQKRQRSNGLVRLEWDATPTPDGAQIDALRLKVSGTVDWGPNFSFQQYIALITPSLVLKAPLTPGRRYRSDLHSYLGVSGHLEVWMTSAGRADACGLGSARFRFVIHSNPTTARALLVKRFGSNFADLSSLAFFSPIPTVDDVFGGSSLAERERPFLGRGQNMLVGRTQHGGSTEADHGLARDRFIEIFEEKLKQLLMEALCPPRLQASTSEEGCLREVADHSLRVSMEWHKLTVERAEIYWDRFEPKPLGVMHRIGERALEVARSVVAKRVDHPLVEQRSEEAQSALVIHLTGTRNIELAVYAKSPSRIRFEVRYLRDFSRMVRGLYSMRTGRLAAVLGRLTQDAARRLPWQQLRNIAAAPQAADVADLPILLDAILAATRRTPSLLSPLVTTLLMTGWVFSDEAEHPGISAAIRSLERQGVLEHTSFQQREERGRRRFALVDRFAAVRLKMLRGFAPDENVAIVPPFDEGDHPDDIRVDPPLGTSGIVPKARLRRWRSRS